MNILNNEHSLLRSNLLAKDEPSAPQERVSGKAHSLTSRPVVRGKFLFAGSEKFWVKGVAYGTFRPRFDGQMFPADEQVERDFMQIASAGFNTVRVYTPPGRRMLDLAQANGLRMIVGLPWEQHIAFLDDPGGAEE
jgi:hypothetical protein